MFKIKKLLTIITALCAIISINVSAEGFTLSCNNCHLKTTDILPSNHISQKDFGKCLSCHSVGSKAGSLGSKIHNRHIENLGNSVDTCYKCHQQNSEGNVFINHKKPFLFFNSEDFLELYNKFSTWEDSDYLANTHKSSGVYCTSCHKSFDFEDEDNINEKCKGCHGDYNSLAELTKSYPRNPHKSHYAKLSCTQCHNVHEKFNDYCDKCHQTNMTWSKKNK